MLFWKVGLNLHFWRQKMLEVPSLLLSLPFEPDLHVKRLLWISRLKNNHLLTLDKRRRLSKTCNIFPNLVPIKEMLPGLSWSSTVNAESLLKIKWSVIEYTPWLSVKWLMMRMTDFRPLKILDLENFAINNSTKDKIFWVSLALIYLPLNNSCINSFA